jgi:hypothetical protein
VPGKQFTGSVEFFYYDSNTYLAWIQQGIEGWWLFKDLYTTETAGRFIFHPVFLAVGLLVRVTGLPLMAAWVLARLVCSMAAVACLYLFLRRAVGPGRLALVAFALITLGSGFGWYKLLVDESFESADVWMPELTFYQSLRWPFLWAIALILMMGFFAAVVDAIVSGSRRSAVAAGLMFACMAFAHPYHVVTFTIVPGVFLALEALRDRRLDRRAVQNFAITGLVAAPAVLYQMAVARIDPAMRYHSGIDMTSPPAATYVAGFGLVLIVLAVLGLPRAWRGGPLARFSIVWAVVGSLLLYFPVMFNRRLATGLIIPVGILAAHTVEEIVANIAGASPTPARRAAAAAVFLLILASVVPTNLLATRQDWISATSGEFPAYISEDLAASLDWLRAAPRGVVLAARDFDNLVPAFTGQTVYAGHWAQTIHNDPKAEQIYAMLAGELPPAEVRRFLDASGARYLVFGPREREISGGAFDPTTLGPVRYENETVQIIEIRNEAAPVP